VTLGNNRSTRARLRRDAVGLLSEAVADTQAYLRGSRADADYEIEAKLTSRWFRAADALWELDQGLSDVCRIKGHYWTEPSAWTQDQIDDANIRLADLVLALDDLLRRS
jgi:hypothetical protein